MRVASTPLPHLHELLNHQTPVIVTKKFDGTSLTVLYVQAATDLNEGVFLVCSRNHVLPKPLDVAKCLYYQMAMQYDLENQLRASGRHLHSG